MNECIPFAAIIRVLLALRPRSPDVIRILLDNLALRAITARFDRSAVSTRYCDYRVLSAARIRDDADLTMKHWLGIRWTNRIHSVRGVCSKVSRSRCRRHQTTRGFGRSENEKAAAMIGETDQCFRESGLMVSIVYNVQPSLELDIQGLARAYKKISNTAGGRWHWLDDFVWTSIEEYENGSEYVKPFQHASVDPALRGQGDDLDAAVAACDGSRIGGQKLKPRKIQGASRRRLRKWFRLTYPQRRPLSDLLEHFSDCRVDGIHDGDRVVYAIERLVWVRQRIAPKLHEIGE